MFSCTRGAVRHLIISTLLPLTSCWFSAQAQDVIKLSKIDPPNWWAGMPKPMLLVQGEHLDGARFRLSDRSLHLDRAVISPNGHWAELWLASSPAKPETITIAVDGPNGKASATYRFDERRKSQDGFAGFSSKDVMYLIMTDRFSDGDPSNNGPDYDPSKPRAWHGGDLRGITQHLDYLQQLGITTVWITPVYQNHEPQSYHGYGATDMYSVDEHFGSLDDLKALSAELHQRGMKLVLDTVPNHVGPSHIWVNDSPEPSWFHGTKADHRLAQGDFKPLTDPHAPWHTQRDVTQGWFANVLPDLNQENSTVAQYLTQNTVWWIEQAGLDGLRIDTFPYVNREFWNSYHHQIHELYPRLTTVGEVYNGDPTITSAFAGGVTRNGVDTGLDTPFDFPTYFALRDVFLHGAAMTKVTEVLRLDSLYPHPERLVPFIGNHDTERFMGEPGATTAKLKLAFTVLLTMRGMPQIYSGDELAMTGGKDPDNRHDFPGGFPNSIAAGVPSAFKENTRPTDQEEMHRWVTDLLALRKAHPSLQSGEEQVLYADDTVLVYARGQALQSGCMNDGQHERTLVVVNNSAHAQPIKLAVTNTALENCHEVTFLLGSDPSSKFNGDSLIFALQPNGAAVLEAQ
jgi:neopullulanase